MFDRKLEDGHCTKNCTICLEKKEYNIVMFKCKHSFHFNCILTWLFEKNFCPLCKKQLIR
jgi:SUMO ligase MMS21 Smc5/6 complex component